MQECSPRHGHHYHNDPRRKVCVDASSLPTEERAKLDQIQESYQELLHDRLIEEVTEGVSLDRPIYRIERLDRFQRALCDKQLFLTNPCRWDDPWENYVLREARLPDGTKVDISALRDSFFAQCWSLSPECEGLWKVRYFDPENRMIDDNGKETWHRFVKIKTTVRALMREVYKFENEKGHEHFTFGLVHYESSETIQSMNANSLKAPSPWLWRNDVIRSLLTKRMGFEYEKEVRLIYSDDFTGKGAVNEIRKGLPISNVDYRHFLKEVEIDPWCSDADFLVIKRELNRCRVQDVIQSSLRKKFDVATVLYGNDCAILTPNRIIMPQGQSS